MESETKIIAGVEVPADLYKFGFSRSYYGERKDDPNRENFNESVIKKCINNIENNYVRSSKRRSSYGLKHEFEKDIGEYVSNGEAIVALIACGYEYSFPKDIITQSPNPFYKVRKKRLRKNQTGIKSE